MSDTKLDFRLADCVEAMKTIPENTVDVVVTSPPYNLGIKYSQYDDAVKRTLYLVWAAEWLAGVHRVMKASGSFFLNLGSCPKNPWLPFEMALVARSNGWVLQNNIAWVKSITIRKAGEEITAGHFKPINSPRYLNDCHEYVWHLTKLGGTPIDRLAVGVRYADKSNLTRGTRGKNGDRRCGGNTWFVPYETINDGDKRPHPASFPPGLAERCFQLHGLRPGLVGMDPFLGAGNAAVAAQRCNLDHFYGFETDDAYLTLAHENTRLTKTS